MTSIINSFYLAFINTTAVLLTTCLYIIAWKQKRIKYNLRQCKINPQTGFFFKFYFNLSRDLLCFLVGKSTTPINIRQRDINKFEKFKSSGGLLLTAHFHNWELMGQFLVNRGFNIVGCSKPLKNRFWNSVLQSARKRISLPTVSKNVTKIGLSHIKNQGIFGVLWDQRVDGSQYNSRFFNRKVSINPIPCFIFEALHPAAYFLFLQPDNNYVRILRIAEPEGKTSKNKMLNRYHRILEIIVKKYPELWYGFAHNRFLIP